MTWSFLVKISITVFCVIIGLALGFPIIRLVKTKIRVDARTNVGKKTTWYFCSFFRTQTPDQFGKKYHQTHAQQKKKNFFIIMIIYVQFFFYCCLLLCIVFFIKLRWKTFLFMYFFISLQEHYFLFMNYSCVYLYLTYYIVMKPFNFLFWSFTTIFMNNFII